MEEPWRTAQREPQIYVYPLRTQMLKQARDPNIEGDSVITVEIDQAQLAELEAHPPPGAKRLQISWTGATFATVWIIDNGDGSIRVEGIPMPGTVTGTALHFPDAPTTFRGREFDNTAANILSIYTGYAGELVSEAEQRWLTAEELEAVQRRIRVAHDH